MSWLNSSASWDSSSWPGRAMRWVYSPAARCACAPQQGVHPPGEEGGKGPEQHQHRQAHHHGDQPQVPLQLHQQGPLAAVLLIEVHRPGHLVAVHHRGGKAAVDHAPGIAGGEGVVALQGGDHLPLEQVPPHGGGLPRVVEDQTGLVGDHQALDLQVLQLVHRLGHRLGGEVVGGNQGVGHQGGLVGEGGLLGPEDQVLVHQQGVGVHQHQQHPDDADIPQGQPGLEGAGQPPPPLLPQPGQGGRFSQFPWK